MRISPMIAAPIMTATTLVLALAACTPAAKTDANKAGDHVVDAAKDAGSAVAASADKAAADAGPALDKAAADTKAAGDKVADKLNKATDAH